MGLFEGIACKKWNQLGAVTGRQPGETIDYLSGHLCQQGASQQWNGSYGELERQMAQMTLHYVQTTFNSCLSTAERKGLVLVNPMNRAERIPSPGESDHGLALDEADPHKLVAGFQPLTIYPIVALTAAIGARRNEVLAFRWTDFDPVKKTIRVERAIEMTRKFGIRFKPPKTWRGLRTVALVSVREEVESYESFVIQERWPDSEGSPMWTNENRARYDRSHLRYPSDLTDDEWKLVEPLIPPGRRGGDKRTVIMREVVNGLMYILSTGCQWRAIPKDLPPRSTLYNYFDLWSWDRTLDLIHHELYVKCREAIGREASPSAAVIDSQSVKSAEKDAMGQAARQL